MLLGNFVVCVVQTDTVQQFVAFEFLGFGTRKHEEICKGRLEVSILNGMSLFPIFVPMECEGFQPVVK
eukprot:m.189664 g.189664  ORF g.189664 m.189664 type:complete len:68 (-) comp18528_c0_seq117:880-1083(-)